MTISKTNPKPSPRVPENDEQARRAIVSALRERCPTGFGPREQSDKIAKLTPSRRKKVLALATAFPGALDLADMDGRTPLTWLARYDEPRLISSFLELGANPKGTSSPSNPRGIHPLAQAVELRHGDALATLALRVGVEDVVVEPCPKDRFGNSPWAGARALFMAAMNTNERGIRTLLSLGADPDAITEAGDTAMHALAYFKKSPLRAGPCADLLAQASPGLAEVRNHAGQTPFDLAVANESPLAAFFLAMEEKAQLQATSSAKARPLPKPRI